MGGSGSGSWDRRDKKATTGQSLSLEISDFQNSLYHHSAGTFTWTWPAGHKATINYFVNWDAGRPTVTLQYRLKYCGRDEEKIELPIRLQATYPHLGGLRWWFTCPLIGGGVVCNRRVGKLYSPPGARYFGCRHCYRLTYRSCQEAHQAERVFIRAGLDRDLTRHVALELAKREEN
jgi:hypothetical protein